MGYVSKIAISGDINFKKLWDDIMGDDHPFDFKQFDNWYDIGKHNYTYYFDDWRTFYVGYDWSKAELNFQKLLDRLDKDDVINYTYVNIGEDDSDTTTKSNLYNEPIYVKREIGGV